MNCSLPNLFRAGLLLALLLSPGRLTAQEPQGAQFLAAVPEPAPPAPDLADLALLATDLSGRLARLETTIAGAVDLSQVKKQLEEISAIVDAYDASQFRALQTSTHERAGQLPQLKADIKSADGALAGVSKSVTEQVRILGRLKKEWLAEQQHWSAWQTALLKDEPFDEVATTLTEIHQTIDAALGLLLQQLRPFLAVQDQVRKQQTRINLLTAEVEGLNAIRHGAGPLDPDPPIFSPDYFSELTTTVRNGAQNGLAQISWPGKSFFIRHVWIVVLQGMLALVLLFFFFRYRQQLERTEHWRFIAKRPIAAGLLVAVVSGAVLYEPPPTMVVCVLTVLIGSAFARLLGGLMEGGWRKQFGYGVIALLITTNSSYALGLSLPLFRVYILMAALVSFVCCLRWAVKSSHTGDMPLYVWALRLCAVLFAIIVFAELRGEAALAEFLFVSLLYALGILLVFSLLRYLVRGALAWAVFTSSPRSVALVGSSAAVIVQRLTFIFDVFIGVVILSALLTAWQVYDSPSKAITALLSVGVTVGSQRLTLGLVIMAIGSVGISYLASSVLQNLLLTEDVLIGREVETGVRVAVARLVHYVLASCGFVVALVVLGVDLTKMTLLASALGIGIGFGLQTVVNNFVCGLILLFERPLRVGDTIEIGGWRAEISKIGLRSTTVRRSDQADMIVPNADLITQQVINWTLTDRHVQITIPVRVAYGSDIPLVMQTLGECALAFPGVMASPEPKILLQSFGDSALNFELQVWIMDIDNRRQVESDLHQEIARRFRQAGIEISFRQRDFRSRSGDSTANNVAATVREPLA